jgi:riboflavin biosynthesis pyrimidine reductase
MQRVHPPPAEEVDPVAAYATDERPPPADRPWVLMNMISSADGGTAVDGVSGGLGGEPDKEVFRAVRGVADVILVASNTVKAESYGPPQTPPSIQEQRRARGQTAKPTMAVVSSKLDFDFASALFTDPDTACIIFVPEDTHAEDRDRVPDRVEVVPVGTGLVDLVGALHVLRQRGVSTLLCEGGPTLVGQLVAADVVDEVCLSLSPSLIGGDSKRITNGPAVPDGLSWLDLTRVLERESFLFLRYVRHRAG